MARHFCAQKALLLVRPIPGTLKKTFYLAEAADKMSDRQHPQDQPAQRESARSFAALPRGLVYPKELDKYEAQWLTFLTDVWEEDTEVVGPIQLHLKIASITIDTHIIARLSDVSAQGEVRLLSFCWLQASHSIYADMHVK